MRKKRHHGHVKHLIAIQYSLQYDLYIKQVHYFKFMIYPRLHIARTYKFAMNLLETIRFELRTACKSCRLFCYSDRIMETTRRLYRSNIILSPELIQKSVQFIKVSFVRQITRFKDITLKIKKKFHY